jgi:hypothetical protein
MTKAQSRNVLNHPFGFPEQSIVISTIQSVIQYHCACGLPIKFFSMCSSFSRSKPPKKLHGRRSHFSGTKERRGASVIALKTAARARERASNMAWVKRQTESVYCNYARKKAL